jgi:N-acylglucosamine-6-phosphate 2-epimerase
VIRSDAVHLPRGLIVSCQAALGSPLGTPEIIAALAKSAVAGGATAIRVNGIADIRAVRAAVTVPLIGLLKRRVDGSPVFITPTLEDAIDVAEAGADLVALDATLRRRPDGRTAGDVLRTLADRGIRVVADVDGLEAGLAAAEAGAEYIASTLAGYTAGSIPADPDIELVRDLVEATSTAVIAEGRYREPGQIRAAFEAGAFAVVVGEAITNPESITRRFVAATPAGAVAARTAALGSLDEIDGDGHEAVLDS